MRTVAVLAMVLVIASLCVAAPYYDVPYRPPDLYKNPPELDEEHPDENYYPQPDDYPQVPDYPRPDDGYRRPTDSSDAYRMHDPSKRHRNDQNFDPHHDWPELEDPNERDLKTIQDIYAEHPHRRPTEDDLKPIDDSEDLERAHRRANNWDESEDPNERDLEPIDDLNTDLPQREPTYWPEWGDHNEHDFKTLEDLDPEHYHPQPTSWPESEDPDELYLKQIEDLKRAQRRGHDWDETDDPNNRESIDDSDHEGTH